MKTTCALCFHRCQLNEGQTGFCHARANFGGKIISLNYGKITSVGLDPIEKKPLNHFHPGGRIFSIGSFGCNLRCPFCQNDHISMSGEESVVWQQSTPQEIIQTALNLVRQGNIGIAYTYNEPLISYEFVMDCAQLAREKSLLNVLVTNGTIEPEPLAKLLPFIDAMNIDLKGFTETFYRKLNGDLETVKRTILTASQKCHIELTTLIIPGENDSEEEMRQMSGWIADISPDIPYHISRFFPRYHMPNKPPTPVGSIYRLAEIARERLTYVYTGNC